MNGAYFTLVLFVLCTLSSRGQVNAACAFCNSGDIRLVGGSSDKEGRLEVCVNSVWGSVCDDNWNDDDARVVCTQLGYSTNGAAAFRDAHFGQGTGAILLNNVECTGSETSLLSCQSSPVGVHNCDHSEDAGVACAEGLCDDGTVRLVGGLLETEGTVEICQTTAWNSLCPVSWGYQESFVVCRQLGLPATRIQWYTNARFGERNGTPRLDKWRCIGNESSLSDCLHTKDECCQSQDVGISCKGIVVDASCFDGSMRLVGLDGPNMVEGRVEYCKNGLWGTVSETGFDTRDGHTA